MAFKGGVVLGTVSLNATGSGTTAIGASSNTGTINIGNGSSSAVNIDCGTSGINVGATANAHTSTFGSGNTTSTSTLQAGTGGLNVLCFNGDTTINSGSGTTNIATSGTSSSVNVGTGAGSKVVTLGSTNTTSATTVQSGSGALNVTSTGGALTINSGTGTLAISNDASATTVNIATGAAAKVATLGSTNGASSLGLRYGTADFTLASATGTVMSALDTGEIVYPLQPAFMGVLPTSDPNVTGAGADYTLGTVTALSIIFDQNGDLTTGGVFTAPVTGKYIIWAKCVLNNNTIQAGAFLNLITSNRTYQFVFNRPGPTNTSAYIGQSLLTDFDAGDTFTVLIRGFGEAGDSEQVAGSLDPVFTAMGGYLAC